LFLIVFYYLFPPECDVQKAPQFGSINCSLGEDGVPTLGDTCSFSCDDGYNIGTTTVNTCNDKGNWTPSLSAECVIGKFYYSIIWNSLKIIILCWHNAQFSCYASKIGANLIIRDKKMNTTLWFMIMLPVFLVLPENFHMAFIPFEVRCESSTQHFISILIDCIIAFLTDYYSFSKA